MSFVLLGILNSQVSGAPAGAGAYDLLETTTLTSSASSVTFDNLDTVAADYKHLQIRVVTKMAGTGGALSNLLQFNSDTASNYRSHFLEGNGSTVASFESGSTNKIFIGVGSNLSEANVFGASVIDILDFSDTSKNTTVRSLGGSATRAISLISGLYNITAAITSISIIPETPDYQIGSRFSLYGIRAA